MNVLLSDEFVVPSHFRAVNTALPEPDTDLIWIVEFVEIKEPSLCLYNVDALT
jgi:hypothetical protein